MVGTTLRGSRFAPRPSDCPSSRPFFRSSNSGLEAGEELLERGAVRKRKRCETSPFRVLYSLGVAMPLK